MFERGKDPKITLGLGKAHQIENWLTEMVIENAEINNDYTIDVEGDVSITDKELTSLPPYIKFNKVSGCFFCQRNKLTTLEGMPREVGWIFDCSHNELTSLKGGPEKVEALLCVNNKLSSFDGFPFIKTGLSISGNKFTALIGAPKKLKFFMCTFNLLTSLEGCPEVKETFDCSYNNITSLKYGPKIIFGFYDCSYNKLTTLKYAPKRVSMGSFNCSHNELISLKGAPEKVTFSFDCSYNKLKTLKGAPKKVLMAFDASNNNIISLANSGIEFIKKSFYIYKNGKLFTEEYVRKHINVRGSIKLRNKRK